MRGVEPAVGWWWTPDAPAEDDHAGGEEAADREPALLDERTASSWSACRLISLGLGGEVPSPQPVWRITASIRTGQWRGSRAALVTYGITTLSVRG